MASCTTGVSQHSVRWWSPHMLPSGGRAETHSLPEGTSNVERSRGPDPVYQSTCDVNESDQSNTRFYPGYVCVSNPASSTSGCAVTQPQTFRSASARGSPTTWPGAKRRALAKSQPRHRHLCWRRASGPRPRRCVDAHREHRLSISPTSSPCCRPRCCLRGGGRAETHSLPEGTSNVERSRGPDPVYQSTCDVNESDQSNTTFLNRQSGAPRV